MARNTIGTLDGSDGGSTLDRARVIDGKLVSGTTSEATDVLDSQNRTAVIIETIQQGPRGEDGTQGPRGEPGSSSIDDNTPGTMTLYSSAKVEQMLLDLRNQLRAEFQVALSLTLSNTTPPVTPISTSGSYDFSQSINTEYLLIL